MTGFSFQHDYLLLDASCAISLYATRKMDEILQVLPVKVAVVDIVYQDEILYVWDKPGEHGAQYKEPINLQPLFDQGLLYKVSLVEEDYAVAIDCAALNLGNGECYTAAVAQRCHWAIGIDDQRARNCFAQTIPQIQLVSTSQIVKYWAETQTISDAEIRTVLKNMGMRKPPKRDVLYNWLAYYL